MVRCMPRHVVGYLKDVLFTDAQARAPVKSLSGGEKARVAIGRALLSRPRLLILDEPLASLDAARRAEILPYVESLRDRTGIPVLYISHAISEVARLATTLVLIDAGAHTSRLRGNVRTGITQEDIP